MGLTSAMLIGFTGIKTNQHSIDTIGNNIANLNTTAFKNQRALFETAFYRTLQGGTEPGDTTGGTNPVQTGYGSQLATIQRNFGQGNLQPTGVPTDLALQGNGFFVLNTAAGLVFRNKDIGSPAEVGRRENSPPGSCLQFPWEDQRQSNRTQWAQYQ